MKKMNKKGFTIVELVIVIAVVAILSAVLIPTFSSVVRNANVSSDTQLVRNLNTALVADTDGQDTMQDALDAAAEAGYDVAKINASATDAEILWDSANKCFVYMDKGTPKYIPNSKTVDAEDYELWTISKTVSNKYSTYLYGYTGDAEVTAIHGLDVGTTAGITEIVYSNADFDGEIILRANSAETVVNVYAPKADVYFYGEAKEVNALAVAPSSLHVSGVVGVVTVAQGNVVIESGAEVNAVIAAPQDGATVSVQVKDASAPTTVYANEGVTVTGKTPVAYDETKKENIVAGATLFAGGTGTEADPYLIENAEQLANINEKYGADSYFKVADGVATIDCAELPSIKLQGSFDGNGVVLNNVANSLFARVEGESSVIKNFTINANIFLTEGVGAVVYKSATLDLTIDSVDVHGTIVGASWVTPYVAFGPGASATWNVTIKNSISDATLVATSGSASGFVGHPYNKVSQGDLTDASLITIIDSAYIGNMTSTGDYGFKYFTINGNSNRVKTYYSAAFIEELGYNPEGTLYNVPVDLTENAGKENEVTYSVIVNEDGSKTFFAGNYGKNVVDHYKPTDKKATLNTTAQATLPANIGDVFTVTKVSGATKAVISLQIAPNDKNNYGSYLGTYMTEEIDVSSIAVGATFTSEEVKYFTININSNVTSETGLSGNIFNVVNAAYGVNAHNGATVKIVQSDANGNVLNITSVTIAAPHAAE